MHGVLLVAAVLAASPAPIKIAAAPLSLVNVAPASGALYLDYFAQQLAVQPGFQVITRGQIEALLGLERQKQLLGCADSNCTAELAGALGVDAVVTGSLGKAGSGFVLNLSIIAARDGKALATHSSRPRNEDAVFDALGAFAKTAAAAVKAALNPDAPQTTVEAPPAVEEPASPARGPAWIPAAAVGAVAFAGAGVLYAMASGDNEALSRGNFDGPADRATVAALRRRGETEQAVSLALTGAGALSLGTAGALFALPADSRARPWVPIAAGGVALVGSAVLFGLAAGDLAALDGGTAQSYADVERLRARGEAERSAALTLGAAGLVGLASGAVMLLAPGRAPTATVLLTRGGAFASLSGRF